MKLAALAPLLVATTARADSWALEARGGLALAPLTANDLFERVDVAATYSWRDRWIIGGAFGFSIDPLSSRALPSGAQIRYALGELGVRVAATPSLAVVLGWRIGYAGIDLGFANAETIDLEPVADIVVPLASALDLRISPIVVDFYMSRSTSEMTVGTSVGIAWRP
jgi:hypothetical protein